MYFLFTNSKLIYAFCDDLVAVEAKIIKSVTVRYIKT